MWVTIILKPAITIAASKKSLKIVFYIYTQIQTAYTLEWRLAHWSTRSTADGMVSRKAYFLIMTSMNVL